MLFTEPASFVQKEWSVSIEGAAGPIEAVASAPGEGELMAVPLVAVICHPHPLHGGTMDNKVVTTLVRTCRDLGVPSVRFNFRGVGASAGVFDQGVGEADDVRRVIAWARQSYPQARLLLAGFSFGSAMAAKVSHELGDVLACLVLVAPPVERYDYDRAGQFVVPTVIVMGDRDELVDAEGVYRWLQALSSPVELIRYPDTGHFFHGRLVDLKRDLQRVLARTFGVAAL